MRSCKYTIHNIYPTIIVNSNEAHGYLERAIVHSAYQFHFIVLLPIFDKMSVFISIFLITIPPTQPVVSRSVYQEIPHRK